MSTEKTGTNREGFFKGPLFVYFLVIVIGAVCIFAAEHHPAGQLALVYELFSPVLSRKFMKGFGEALVIAGIVGMTIDHYNLVRHRRSITDMEAAFSRMASDTTSAVANEASANGILSVYKTLLSEAILGAISKDVLKAELIRTYYKIELVLRREGECVRAIQTTDSKVSNQTMKPLKYLFAFEFDKTMEGMPPFDGKINTLTFDGVPQDPKEIEGILETANDKNVAVRTSVEIKAEKSVRIVFETSELRANYDVLFWSTLLPTDEMRLTVIVPDNDIDVVVETLHPESADEDVASGMSRHWVLNGAALPGQGFLVKWKVRPNVVS